MAKTWKVTINEFELRTLISAHAQLIAKGEADTAEDTARLHDLMKRLNKETPEIDNDPRPQTVETTEIPPVPTAPAWG